jgi:glutaredoxin
MNKNIKITIYTIPGCPFCKTAKEWLSDHNLKYEEIVVPTDKSERKILDKFAKHFPDDIRGVPLIVVEKEGREHYFNEEKDPRLIELIL